MDDAGEILVGYVLICGRCKTSSKLARDFGFSPAPKQITATQCATYHRNHGWKRTVHYGWICPDCAREHKKGH